VRGLWTLTLWVVILGVMVVVGADQVNNRASRALRADLEGLLASVRVQSFSEGWVAGDANRALEVVIKNNWGTASQWEEYLGGDK